MRYRSLGQQNDNACGLGLYKSVLNYFCLFWCFPKSLSDRVSSCMFFVLSGTGTGIQKPGLGLTAHPCAKKAKVVVIAVRNELSTGPCEQRQ